MPKQIMRLSKKGVDFIKRWEGFIPFVYDDLVTVKGRPIEWKGGKIVGTLTIGYGHTAAARGRHPMNVGSRITEARAAQLLDDDLDPVEEYINRVVKVPLTQGQFDALVSITMNFGEGNLAKSVLLARLNAGDYRGARNAFDLYVNSKGRRLKGLVDRRNAEQVLWDSADPALAKSKVIELRPDEYSSRDKMPATPKEIDTPVQPNAAKTVEGSGGLAQAGLSTGGMAKEGASAWEQATDYANQAAEVKTTAEALGVEPIGLANVIGTKGAAFVSYLFSSPLFWVFFAMTIIGIVIYFVRRWKARQEIVPDSYEVAGTPLPQLIEGDTGYAGIDTSDDFDTRYYKVDPAFEDTHDEAPVELEPEVAPRKRKATKRKKAK